MEQTATQPVLPQWDKALFRTIPIPYAPTMPIDPKDYKAPPTMFTFAQWNNRKKPIKKPLQSPS